MKRTILIDADILAYRVAAINEETFDFGEGGVAVTLSPEKIVTDIEDIVVKLRVELEADDYRICLSDPKKNWRKQLEPTYKEHRKNAAKPQLLDDTKAFLYREYASAVVEWLEADDVMGILATNPKAKRDFIIVSEDKDMRTIPAKVYHPHRPDQGVMEVTTDEANRFLLWQTLCGDPTDGYPGCPGIGKSSEYVKYLMEDADGPEEMWDTVLDAYASKGLTEEHAIHQARLACICRHTNWIASEKRVRLWNPLHLLV